MDPCVRIPDFVTGCDLAEGTLPWTIEGYPLVRKNESMINSQSFNFAAGGSTGHKSHWELSLRETREGEKRWIGFFLRLKNQFQVTDEMLEKVNARVRCVIRNQEGEVIKDAATKSIRAKALKEVPEGIINFIDADDANFSPERLVIQVAFKLLTPTRPHISLEAAMEKFQAIFLEKFGNDIEGILKIPDACKDIKIVASDDKKEFTVKRGILIARCEALAAMLRSDEVEGNSGVIRLSGFSSKALNVFLEFLKTGVLLPEWSETKIIVDLTCFAGKYQIQELLQFLDVTLEKVCQPENVFGLVTLATQWSLKVAEEELMTFVRENTRVISVDDYMACVNSQLGIRTGPTPGWLVA